ncbi:hypothetical protein [Mesonia maritima]|uniref:Lipoprotein n=1 Tax=Mesonia maritima TaxID=1793873 RepID=A0ABU1K9A6_9FLAO|nr:hypothetical protein [Mesonia maritima]MDR6302198.1 hypothetical protein [Mesonia maritima]
MKILLVLAISLLSFSGCKEDKSNDSNSMEYTESERDISENNVEDKKGIEVEEENEEKIIASSGMYQRIREDKKGEGCNCDCLTIDFNAPQSICIDEESGLKIQVNFRKENNQEITMYYVKGAGETKVLKKIPWEKFDKGKPLAKINFTDNNHFTLDWIGFTLDDEVAVDYAILGKKNLEGEFQKL